MSLNQTLIQKLLPSLSGENIFLLFVKHFSILPSQPHLLQLRTKQPGTFVIPRISGTNLYSTGGSICSCVQVIFISWPNCGNQERKSIIGRFSCLYCWNIFKLYIIFSRLVFWPRIDLLQIMFQSTTARMIEEEILELSRCSGGEWIIHLHQVKNLY